jgi:hypothetical protein
MQRVARAATRNGAVVQVAETAWRRRRGARYNYLLQELAANCLLQSGPSALGLFAPRGGRGRKDFSRDGRPRGPAGRLPRRGGPCAAGPRSRPASGTRAARLPPLDTATQRTRLRRGLRPRVPSRMELSATSKILVPPGRAAQLHRVLAEFVISDHIAALPATQLYFAPVLRSRPTLVRPVLHNQ